MKSVAAIVLAGGIGKRMESNTAKVLLKIANRPMILRTLHNLEAAGLDKIVLVANPNNASVLKKTVPKRVDITIQNEPKGTADAARIGLKKIKKSYGTILIANGDDSAFYSPETIKRVISQHINTNSAQTFLSVNVNNPYGLGRIIEEQGKVAAIVEEREASLEQKKIKEINAGLYAFDNNWLRKNISKVKKSKKTGEKYLVDLVNIAIKDNKTVNSYLLKDNSQWHGINTQSDLKLANIKFNKKIHIMGAAGAGASAIVEIAKNYGFDVSGCDINPNSAYVENSQLKIKKGHSTSHVYNIGMLVVSPAVTKNDSGNDELKEAKKNKIPIKTWQEFQGKYLQKNKFVISVAGGYGKSTTTAMISQIMISEGLDPTCEVGAVVKDWGTNYKVGKSRYYINEADEYANNFLNYSPDIAVILNIAWDHPDYFKDRSSLEYSYKKFINNIKKGGYLVIGEDKKLKELAKKARKDIKIINMQEANDVKLSIIGEFRKKNAAAALTVVNILKLDKNRSIRSLQNFRGVARRLEFKGKVKGAVVYDDYAVQPFTVMTSANALSEKFNSKRVVLVFEPHTFSRINIFFNDFITNLTKTKVDTILVTDVFAAREKGDIKKLSKKLANALGNKAVYSGSIEQTASYLKKNIKNFDVILSMGAGDVYKIYKYLSK